MATTTEILNSIHQCVIHSTVRHVLNFSPELLVEYFATYPFYRGADTLYYLFLKKFGKIVHYTADGRHIVSVQPELAGVYVLAEQDMKALANRDVPNKTIYSIVKASIDRTITCERYQMRHSIIIGEASVEVAAHIPSIALNLPQYQRVYQQSTNSVETINVLIEQDCWEAIPGLNFVILTIMLSRMGYIASIAPDLWKLILQSYYTTCLTNLKIQETLPSMTSRQIHALNQLLPNLIRMPPGLNTLGIRLWYAERHTRAYILGFDLYEGVPSDEIISERLQHLQQVGIEKYADEITGIYMDEHNKLTGKMGNHFYPELVGKTLMNTRTTSGGPIGAYYISDILPVMGESGGNVYMLTVGDLMSAIDNTTTVTSDHIYDIISEGRIPLIKEPITRQEANNIYAKLSIKIGTVRGVQARVRLVEVLSHDIIGY